MRDFARWVDDFFIMTSLSRNGPPGVISSGRGNEILPGYKYRYVDLRQEIEKILIKDLGSSSKWSEPAAKNRENRVLDENLIDFLFLSKWSYEHVHTQLNLLHYYRFKGNSLWEVKK